jgi:phosphopantetheine adenylyltransferase
VISGRQHRISTKETNHKRALKIAEEFERAAMTKWTIKQVQVVLDRLHEEVSGERVIRAAFSQIPDGAALAPSNERIG